MTTFLQTGDDLKWLAEGPLKGLTLPQHACAVIDGNEYAPEAVHLFAVNDYRCTFEPNEDDDMQEVIRWQSNAQWPTTLGVSENPTTDTHNTRAEADNVCRLLKKFGYGGQNSDFPLRVWVTPIFKERPSEPSQGS